MKTIICENSQLAEKAADFIIRVLKDKPEAVLALACGQTMKPVWAQLADAYAKGAVNFEKARVLCVTELIGVREEQSCRYALENELLRRVNIRSDHCFFPNPDAPEDYDRCGGTVFLANPNAPTGLALGLGEIARILERNPENVVVVDEAYVDFGTESAVSLLGKYPNLVVTQTFSKSRSLAGLRLGFAAAGEELIRDLKTMQYSTNPYNVDRLAQAAGIACLEEEEKNRAQVRQICENRAWTGEQLRRMGFEATESRGNFLFVRHPAFPGSSLRDQLREKGILIRWFNVERIRDWSRISIGMKEDMEALVRAIGALLEEA